MLKERYVISDVNLRFTSERSPLYVSSDFLVLLFDYLRFSSAQLHFELDSHKTTLGLLTTCQVYTFYVQQYGAFMCLYPQDLETATQDQIKQIKELLNELDVDWCW